jgi:hypothetical protein
LKKLLHFFCIFCLVSCSESKKSFNSEIITSRNGEFSITSVKDSTKVFLQNKEILEFPKGTLISLYQIIELDKSDLVVLSKETSSCQSKFQILILDSNQKYNAFPEIGTCKDIPEIIKKDRSVYFKFLNSSRGNIVYKYENNFLEVIENSIQTAIDSK